MKVYIQTNCENYKNELDEVVRAFAPYLLLSEDGMPVSACISVADGKAKTSVSAEGCAPVSGVYDVDITGFCACTNTGSRSSGAD